MSEAPILSCSLVVGFETLTIEAAADLLELVLQVPMSRYDRPDQGGVVYEFQPSPEPPLGRLVQVLLTRNQVQGFGWKEPQAPQCSFVTEIFWRTRNLLEIGRLSMALESLGDARLHLLTYEVFGDLCGDGRRQQLRRVFGEGGLEEARWDDESNS